MEAFYPLLWDVAKGLIGILCYMMLIRRAAEVVQPVRLDMARRGRAMIASPTTSSEDKSFAQFCLNYAFDARLPVFASIAMVIVGPICIFKMVRKRLRGDGSADVLAPNTGKITLQFTLSTLAANPFFGAILFFEFLVCALVTTLLTAQLKSWQSILKAVLAVEFRGILVATSNS